MKILHILSHLSFTITQKVLSPCNTEAQETLNNLPIITHLLMARVKQSLSLSDPSPFHHEAKWVICFLREGSKTTEQSNSCLLVHSLSPPQNLTADFFQLTDTIAVYGFCNWHLSYCLLLSFTLSTSFWLLGFDPTKELWGLLPRWC